MGGGETQEAKMLMGFGGWLDRTVILDLNLRKDEDGALLKSIVLQEIKA